MRTRTKQALLTALIILLGLFLWSKSPAQSYPVDNGIDKIVVGEGVWVYKLHQNYIRFAGRGSNTDFKPVTEWIGGSLGAINLNMFVPGAIGAIPEGYTKLNDEVIQPTVKSNWNGFIVWNPDTLIIMDKYKDGLDKIMSWPNVSQNIRMVIEDGKRNRWQIDAKKWSVSTIATTTEGHVLFIHSRYPYTMHDYINMLLEADLDIHRMVYLEGGPESQVAMYGGHSRPVRGWVAKEARHGSYETGFVEHDEINEFWPIPWVLTLSWK